METKLEHLELEQQDEATIATVLDSQLLDQSQIEELGHELFSVAEGQENLKLVLDLAKVKFLSSAVLGKFVALFKRIQAEGGQMRVCGLEPPILEVFQITRLHEILQVHPDRQSALESF